MPTWTPTTTQPEAAGVPPGVYERLARPQPVVDVRLDTAAFIGLAERGPIGEAVGIGSMSEFSEVFGRAGGGRQLPDAVRLFFANGGRRLVVVRALGTDARAASGELASVVDAATAAPPELHAHDVGRWGDDLSVSWTWQPRAVGWRQRAELESMVEGLRPPAAAAPPVGTCLRATTHGGGLAEVVGIVVAHVPLPGGVVQLELDPPAPAVAAGGWTPWQELRGQIVARWADRVEVFRDLGVDARHPEWVSTALAESKLLAVPTTTGPWLPAPDLLGPDALHQAVPWRGVTEALEGAETTDRSVFFEPVDASPLDALLTWDDGAVSEPVALVAVPDLMHLTEQLDGLVTDPDLDASTRFGDCVPPEPEVTPPAGHAWPLLSIDHDPAEVGLWQTTLIEHCEHARRIALLDVPPRIDAGAVVAWRAAHASDRAAAYAPWLRIVDRDALRTVPPCGAVAGIVARTEALGGVHAAPANAVVLDVFGVQDDPLLPDPGFLHAERIDAMRVTPRGLRLMGSRTTSFDADWTHLNVRRVVDWLSRQLALDAQWAVFEPNNRQLWRRLVHLTQRRLISLGAAGAWAGATAAESWFVRCDATTTTLADRDAGRVVVQVGVAPAVPAEFIVFELALTVGGANG